MLWSAGYLGDGWACHGLRGGTRVGGERERCACCVEVDGRGKRKHTRRRSAVPVESSAGSSQRAPNESGYGCTRVGRRVLERKLYRPNGILFAVVLYAVAVRSSFRNKRRSLKFDLADRDSALSVVGQAGLERVSESEREMRASPD